MPIGSGVAAQFAYRQETTKNTRIAGDHWVEFVSESLVLQKRRIERTGRRAGRRTNIGWSTGNQWVEGNVSFELVPNSMASFLKNCIGGVVTAGVGPYTHTITPGDLTTMSMQVGRPDSGGTVRPFDYIGCMVDSWTLSFDATGDGQMVQFEASIIGYGEDTAQSLLTPSYPTVTSLTSVQSSLTIAGSAYCVDSLTFTGANNIRSNFEACAAQAGRANITENGVRTYSGTLVSDFKDLTAYNRFVNGTEAALVTTISAGASASIVLTSNVRFDGETPNVTSDEVLKQSLPFVCTGTTDAAVLTVVVTNGDSAP
jgi:hypothetical protein